MVVDTFPKYPREYYIKVCNMTYLMNSKLNISEKNVLIIYTAMLVFNQQMYIIKHSFNSANNNKHPVYSDARTVLLLSFFHNNNEAKLINSPSNTSVCPYLLNRWSSLFHVYLTNTSHYVSTRLKGCFWFYLHVGFSCNRYTTLFYLVLCNI